MDQTTYDDQGWVYQRCRFYDLRDRDSRARAWLLCDIIDFYLKTIIEKKYSVIYIKKIKVKINTPVFDHFFNTML